jgi:hypothetical protein
MYFYPPDETCVVQTKKAGHPHQKANAGRKA